MPMLIISTNSTKTVSPDQLKQLSEDFAAAIKKPEAFCNVAINRNPEQLFGGKSDNCAVVNLHSIGNLSVDDNQRISETIGPKISEALDIAIDRMYILFNDYNKSWIGWNKTTFHDLLDEHNNPKV